MKLQILAKFISAAVFGTGAMASIYLEQAYWLRQGKDAFLAFQGRDFEDFSNMYSVWLALAGVAAMVLIFALYELVALAILKLLKLSTKNK